MDVDGSILSFWEFWATVGLLMCSAFFSASEIALAALNRVRLRSLADQGVANAALLTQLVEKPTQSLTAILIGNNVVNVLASTLAAIVAIQLMGARGAAVSAVVMTLTILTFGEILPKSIAAHYTESVALTVSRPIALLTKILSPVVIVFDGISAFIIRRLGGNPSPSRVTEEEIQTIITMGQEEGLLEKHEHDLIRSVFDFGKTTAEEIMVPRIDIAAISAQASMDELEAAFAAHPFSRLPVYDGTLDNIIGAVHMKDFVRSRHRGEVTLSELLRPVLFVPETLPIENILQQMRRERISTAIVLDEYGQTVGMITPSDLVEEIMGTFLDEHDDQDDELVTLAEGEIEVDGGYLIEDLNEECDLDIPTGVVNTIGGYIFHKLGRIPKVKDRIALGDHMEAMVVEMNGRRVGKVRLIRTAPFGEQPQRDEP